AFLRTLGLQRLEPLLHGLQIVPQPYAAHASRRDGVALLLELVGHPHLAARRLVDRHLYHRRLDRRVDAVLLDRLPLADLGQRQLAALLVQLLKAIETVAAVSHHLARLGYAAELLGQLQQADLGFDDLLFRRHCGLPFFAPPVVRSTRLRLAPLTTGNDAHHFVNNVRSNPNFYN